MKRDLCKIPNCHESFLGLNKIVAVRFCLTGKECDMQGICLDSKERIASNVHLVDMLMFGIRRNPFAADGSERNALKA